MFCSTCGSTLDGKFCSVCGAENPEFEEAQVTIESSNKERSDFESQLATMHTRIAELEDNLQKADHKIKNLNFENRELKNELDLERQGKTNEEMQVLEEENRKLKKEINDLSSKNSLLNQEISNNTVNVPITMWGYFGYGILFGIPLVGWIINLVFAFGGTQNINLRNFARSKFCLLIVLGILILFFFLLGGSLSSLMSPSYYYY